MAEGLWKIVVENDIAGLSQYLQRTQDDYGLLHMMVQACWWDGIQMAVQEYGMDPNRAYNGYRLLDVWHEDVMEESFSYTELEQNEHEEHLRWGLQRLIGLGCNPYVCEKFVLDEYAYSYFMQRVAKICKRSVVAILGCKGWMTRDTRFLIAQAVWETRRDWEAWLH